ncbi:MAG TPA: PH domain-containing protein [Nannocystis sp.]|jgi:hypothetical protein
MILHTLARRSACIAVLLSANLAAAAPPGLAAAPENSSPTLKPAPAPAPTGAALDEVQLTSGELVHGRVTNIAEGAYVTMIGAKGTQTFPWTEVARVRFERGAPADAVELDLAAKGFEVDLPVTVDSPYIELQTRDGRPMPLLRLRNSGASVSERYSTGFDEVCRAPCGRAVAAGDRRFFVDSNPYTASKVFEIPRGQKYVRLMVRPGNFRMRRAGVGLMIAGAIGFATSIALIATPGQRTHGAGLMSLASLVPVGGLLFGLSRTKVRVEMMAAPARAAAR